MAKREFIEKAQIPYKTNTRKGEIGYHYAMKFEIDDMSTFTEQDIVNPYLTEILEELNRMGGRNLFKDDNEYSRLFDFIDNLLSEQGDKE